ncbi:MAG: precorrin-3B synthase [Pseudomonas sp.]|uniref:precorrin-3B synthase n=1 Tax=Pseudomonas sp. TaxID=306 RepID=UPI00271E32C0|nr:precorrin-3B synthase [Pseudomonas sp.]MDO9619405.1 precorrin-3B synthase [Pseudomonas sp.]MDP2447354.1 precorrin-3B synthase [Pseudomonas sp.]MDZ4332042.1 precorrin-3B synthase [Pseudomonas sp.]
MRDLAATLDLPAPRPEKPGSACPGLLRIVPALDGGICRVKLAGGVLSSQQARAIAEAAERCASGVLELTNRSNLQIRGVLPGQQAELIERLLAAGLGPSSPAADDIRNLLLSPAAGLDSHALLDTRPLTSALLDLLQSTPALHGLSAKFAIQLDGGEALAMLEHPHDIWLSALPGTPARLAFGLAGCPTDKPLGVVDIGQAVPLVEQLLRLFLDLAGNEHSRMRQLLSVIPAHQLLQQLQTRLPFALQAVPLSWQRTSIHPHPALGIYPQQQAGLCMVAASSRLGRINAAQLRALTELAEQYGDASLRLTPWQGLLLPNIPEPSADKLLHTLAELGLLIDAQEPLSNLIACTGSAACAKGLADSKADALRLAERLRTSTARPHVHLSACPRSCAAAHTAPFTLLASSAGHYQLYQRTREAAGFGQLLASAMTIDEAGDWFAAHCATGNSNA